MGGVSMPIWANVHADDDVVWERAAEPGSAPIILAMKEGIGRVALSWVSETQAGGGAGYQASGSGISKSAGMSKISKVVVVLSSVPK